MPSRDSALEGASALLRSRHRSSARRRSASSSPGASRRAQPPKRDALQREHGVPDGLAHAAHLAVAALVDRELERSVRRSRRTRAGAVSPSSSVTPARSARDRALAHRARRRARAVGLGHFEARMGQPVGELAVVGQQDQPARVGVEAPDRVQAPSLGATSSTTVGRPWVSLRRRDTPTRLVDGVDDPRLGPGDAAAVDASRGCPRRRRARDRSRPPRDAHAPGGDQRLGGAPRGDAGVGEVLG